MYEKTNKQANKNCWSLDPDVAAYRLQLMTKLCIAELF